LSRHINGVWMTKRRSMPSDNVTCNAQCVVAQSG
jgi:hypothetical protein